MNFPEAKPRTTRRDEVHVWRIALDPPPPCVEGLGLHLTPEETARANRYLQPGDRERFIAGRGWLRSILGRYLGADPARLEIRYGPRGKPELAGDCSISFNLAHSRDLGLLAVTEGRQVGIDLEAVRPMPDAGPIATRFFSASERSTWLALPEADRNEAFFRCWTRKEAFLKATGMGLSMPLDQFDVTLGPGAPARLIAVREQPEEAGRWVLREIDVGPGFIAALAVEGAGWRPLVFEATDGYS